MLTPQDVLAAAAEAPKQLLARFLTGFTNDNHTTTTPELPNHLAWCLGHSAMYLNHAASQLDGLPLPPTHFIPGSTAPPERQQFATEIISFGSQPDTDPAQFPPLERCIEIFNTACDRLATAVRNASDEQLARQVNWMDQPIPLYGLVLRVTFHCGFHGGEIADLRRALGLGSALA